MTAGRAWEDPATWSDWIARLAEKLVQRDVQYIGLKQIDRMKLDPDDVGNEELTTTDPRANSTLIAAAAVSAIVAALQEIPTFETGWGVATLRDVAAALSDVDAGARPKIFEPRPDQKAPKIGVGRRLLIASLVLYVELLKASKETEADACAIVATAFTSVGHRGRKGGALSPKTIQEWCLKSGDDVKLRIMIDNGLGNGAQVLDGPLRALRSRNSCDRSRSTRSCSRKSDNPPSNQIRRRAAFGCGRRRIVARRPGRRSSMEPITVTVDGAKKALGIGTTKIYELIGEGKLATIKIGRRTLVKTDSIRQLVEAA